MDLSYKQTIPLIMGLAKALKFGQLWFTTL